MSNHLSYPSVINPNKMSYFWSLHKRLGGSWIGHIEGPWSLSCLMKSVMKILDNNFFLWKSPKPPAQYVGKNSLPFGSTVTVMLRGNRSSPILHLPATTTIDSSPLSWICLWLLIVATVCSTSCVFCAYLLLAPSAQACMVRKSFLTLFGRFWARFVLFLDSLWIIWTNYWLLREFE